MAAVAAVVVGLLVLIVGCALVWLAGLWRRSWLIRHGQVAGAAMVGGRRGVGAAGASGGVADAGVSAGVSAGGRCEDWCGRRPASLVRHARVIDFRCTETVFEPDFRCSIPLHFYVAEYVAFDILCNASFVALFRCAALLPDVRSGFG